MNNIKSFVTAFVMVSIAVTCLALSNLENEVVAFTMVAFGFPGLAVLYMLMIGRKIRKEVWYCIVMAFMFSICLIINVDILGNTKTAYYVIIGSGYMGMLISAWICSKPALSFDK